MKFISVVKFYRLVSNEGSIDFFGGELDFDNFTYDVRGHSAQENVNWSRSIVSWSQGEVFGLKMDLRERIRELHLLIVWMTVKVMHCGVDDQVYQVHSGWMDAVGNDCQRSASCGSLLLEIEGIDALLRQLSQLPAYSNSIVGSQSLDTHSKGKNKFIVLHL
jgi:hypothetical protein